jgi:hypothetical protein
VEHGGARRGQSTAAAYVPLSFAPGEAYQFDWSHEVVLLNGVTVIVKAAHVRLCHSRMLFVRCYPREMVFDAHDRAFALFKGTCGRGIYDNMKTAVETIFVGKGRLYNRRFMQMCSHYLVDPVACTPVCLGELWRRKFLDATCGLTVYVCRQLNNGSFVARNLTPVAAEPSRNSPATLVIELTHRSIVN